MKIKIKNDGFEGYGGDVKRFYTPFYLEWDCPKCGETNTTFEDYYISNPPYFTPFEDSIYCPECEYESTVMLQLDFSLKIVDETNETSS